MYFSFFDKIFYLCLKFDEITQFPFCNFIFILRVKLLTYVSDLVKYISMNVRSFAFNNFFISDDYELTLLSFISGEFSKKKK